MEKKYDPEVKDNENSLATKPQQQEAITSNQLTASSSNKPWKLCVCVLAVAILINFLLIVGMGVALSHYHAKMSYEIKHIELRGDDQQQINGSGPPGTLVS